MAERETRSKALEWYENLNKLTLVGALGFAVVASFVAPALVVPALALAAVDVAQIVVINQINRRRPQPQAA
jgi:hypothetical protein